MSTFWLIKKTERFPPLPSTSIQVPEKPRKSLQHSYFKTGASEEWTEISYWQLKQYTIVNNTLVLRMNWNYQYYDQWSILTINRKCLLYCSVHMLNKRLFPCAVIYIYIYTHRNIECFFRYCEIYVNVLHMNNTIKFWSMSKF